MRGDEPGMLKILFDRHTRKLLGVHALGPRATEIIYVSGSVEYFRDMVFNYTPRSPKLTESLP